MKKQTKITASTAWINGTNIERYSTFPLAAKKHFDAINFTLLALANMVAAARLDGYSVEFLEMQNHKVDTGHLAFRWSFDTLAKP